MPQPKDTSASVPCLRQNLVWMHANNLRFSFIDDYVDDDYYNLIAKDNTYNDDDGCDVVVFDVDGDGDDQDDDCGDSGRSSTIMYWYYDVVLVLCVVNYCM